MAQSPDMPNDTRSIQVLVRFLLRIAVLSVFAALGHIGFTRSFAALLWLSTILCVVAGTLRREAWFDTSLTHWDEGLAYAALYCLMSSFNAAPAS
jgi:uncharacterized membrane protein YjjP (DUF1212 family)